MIDRIRTRGESIRYNFDEGAAFIERLIAQCNHAAIVSIIGQPHSGKSTLCKKILNSFAQKDIYGYMGYPDEIYNVPYEPAFYLLQDTPPHCRATRLILEHFKREPDARALIGPPGFIANIPQSTLNDIADGDYSLIIENNHAARKPI